MRHIFLTGPQGAGKTGSLLRALERALPVTGGFSSGFSFTRASGSRLLYLSRAGLPPARDSRSAVAVFGPGREPLALTGRFDAFAAGPFARSLAGAEAVVADECSFLEAGAPVFRRAVLDALDGDTPVIGVARVFAGAYTEEIISHPRVDVVGISARTRDEAAGRISDLLEESMPSRARVALACGHGGPAWSGEWERRAGAGNFSAVLSGPSLSKTAREAADRLGIGLVTDAALESADRGSWNGEGPRRADEYARWRSECFTAAFPGGESLAQAAGRITARLEALPASARVLVMCDGATMLGLAIASGRITADEALDMAVPSDYIAAWAAPGGGNDAPGRRGEKK